MTPKNQTNAQTPQARSARPGAQVRHNDLSEVYRPQHRILTKRAIDRGETCDALFKITTNQGEWVFWGHELVTFPRRPDGSHVDWWARGVVPRPYELAVDDWLPPMFEVDQESVDLDEQMDTVQRVTAIFRHPARPEAIEIVTYANLYGAQHHLFGLAEPVSFPHTATGQNFGQPDSRLELFGPYQRDDGSMIFYAAHPSGRGRWPKWLEAPFEISPGVWVGKPPHKRHLSAWPKFAGTSANDRHPYDPKWGHRLVPRAEVDIAPALAALATYQEGARS